MLKFLITSLARRKILRYFFVGGENFSPHIRKIVKENDLEINAVRRELKNLEDAKILILQKRGNRVHYFLNSKHRLYYDLASLVAKEEGLFASIYKNRKKLGKVLFGVGSLNFFLKQVANKDDLAVLVVGDVYPLVLEAIIKKYEKKENLEVNYMLVSESEFNLLRTRNDELLNKLLMSARCVFLGNQKKFLY
ncbi:hypothetical protein KA001_00195 [Patescibacteria group bacterium]|nr:hypothetical protein [Patescibacteria group bacterium]